MPRHGRLFTLILLCAAGTALAQPSLIDVFGKAEDALDLKDVQESQVHATGQGERANGIDLAEVCRPRHHMGDDPFFAGRTFVDTSWTKLDRGLDSLRPGIAVHWVRYHLSLAPELRDMTFELGIETRAAFDLYLNGRHVLGSVGGSDLRSRTHLADTDSLPRTAIPLAFLADGSPEVIALRLVGPPGSTLRASGLHATLHAPDAIYLRNRRMMHHGVFIGINAIILLLAIVLGLSDRTDRSWPLLALLSFISALGTWCDVAGDEAALGLAPAVLMPLEVLSMVLYPWPLYLLVRLLGQLHGQRDRGKEMMTTIAVLVMTAVNILMALAVMFLGLRPIHDLGTSGPELALFMGAFVLALLFLVSLCWLLAMVVRLGLKLLRIRGYARWIGLGALASSLLSIVLEVAGQFSGLVLGSWLALMADYCSYVAVPASVAVYLAVRSAHQNRLVARQRDELDAEVKERTAELRAERDRSEELLLNILPQEVADELKAKGSADAKLFDQATVLFTDFRGFTRMSEQVGPSELVQELNTCFKAFDAIMGRHRIEKIKTIGDSYMAAGGLPDPDQGGPVEVVRAALEMQGFMRLHKAERMAAGRPYFEMRVGIHTGAVVAGIVGVKKFQYDIWGDTVNTASRMESTGEIGRVNISAATYALVKEAPGLLFTPRGHVQAKGKGELEMWFVDAGG